MWSTKLAVFVFNPYPRIYLLIFRERGSGGEGDRETSMWERNINQLPPARAPTGIKTLNLGTRRGQVSNPTTFWCRDNTPTNWVTQPGVAVF